MARGYPSMTALLGLLAVAGFQNRDKIAELLGGLAQGGARPASAPDAGRPAGGEPPSALDQIFGNLGGLFGGAGPAASGGLISGGLSELVKRFTENGKGDVAQSWVKDGPNRAISSGELEEAIGQDTLDNLAQQTGLSRQEILSRLSRDLPDAVDRYTPDGTLPAQREAHA